MDTRSNTLCYKCGEPLGRDPSREHIVLNALGGRLCSDDLLHRGCNNEFGHDLDTELASALNVCMVLLGVRRGDGQAPPKHLTETLDGRPVEIDVDGNVEYVMKGSPVRELRTDGQVQININAPDVRIAAQCLRGLARKYKAMNPMVWLDRSMSTLEPCPPLKLGVSIGSNSHLRSIAKTAVGYFLHAGGMPQAIAPSIKFVLNGEGSIPIRAVSGHSFIRQSESDVLHHLEVCAGHFGVHVYVELFSTFRFHVSLSEEPQHDLMSSYTFDCLRVREVSVETSFRECVVSRAIGSLIADDDAYRRDVGRLFALGLRRIAAKWKENLASQAVDAVAAKYRLLGREPTIEQFTAEVFHAMEPVLLPQIRAASETRRQEALTTFQNAKRQTAMPPHGGDH